MVWDDKMIKRIVTIALIFMLLLPSLVLASSIENAEYYGIIEVSNNSTATTNVATVASINTTNLIAGDYLNATANNTVVRNTSGADVPFMPGYTPGGYPWAMWVPTIGADTYLSYILYTANSTGGDINYFPGSGGMTVGSDNASMEVTDDFSLEIAGWIDTESGFNDLLDKQSAVGVSITDDEEITGIVYYDEPVEEIPAGFAGWQDIDVSGYVPSYATGVIVHLYNGGARDMNVRMNGSTDNRFNNNIEEHYWAIIGLDVNKVFEVYLQDNTCHLLIVGFTGTGFTFNTNGLDVSLGVALAWTDIDLSVSAPDAIGAIFEVYNGDPAAQGWGFRMDGSADARINSSPATSGSFAIIGCDSVQVVEGYVADLDVDFYLIGYITAGATFKLNADDISIGVAGWTDIDISTEAPASTHAIVEVIDIAPGPDDYGLRRNGSTENVYQSCNWHFWSIVECDADQVIEGQVSNVNVDFFLVGYFHAQVKSPYELTTTASGISSGEMTVTTSMAQDPYTAAYDDSVNIGVSMGSGILPVRVLERQELSAPAASVTFSNIDTLVADWDAKAGVTSRHLVVVVNAKSPDAIGFRSVIGTFNGDGGNNYHAQNLSGDNVAVTASRSTNPFFQWALIPGTTFADAFGGGIVLIPHAFNVINHKVWIGYGGAVEAATRIRTGRWANTNAIDTIALSLNIGNFDTGSTLILGVVDERYLVEEEYNASADFLPVFDTIPQDGYDLCIVGYPRSDRAAATDFIKLELNNDAVGASYNHQYLWGTGAGTASNSAAGNNMGVTAGDNAGANEFGAFYANYSQYAEGANHPHILTLSGFHESVVPTSYVAAWSARWNNVAAITKIELLPSNGTNFKAGSLFSLYRVPRYVIDRQELSAPAATITFDNIPATYEMLQLNIYARSAVAALSEDVEITLNADAVAANYDFQELTGTGAVVAAARNAASQVIMAIPAANEGANEFGGGVITIPIYTRTDGHKHLITLSGTQENQVIIRSSRWEDSSAITRIDLDLAGANNFVAGSVFELAGVIPTQSFMIEVDGDVEGIEAANAYSVVDNGQNWVVGGDATPYIDYYHHTVDDVLQSDIEWRYGSEFYDSSYYALDFDGVDDFINVPNDASQLLTTGGTIEAWIKPDGAGGNNSGRIVDKSAGDSGDSGYKFQVTATNSRVRLQINAGVAVHSADNSITFGTDTWYYVVATWDNTGLTTMYVDGALSGVPAISADPVGITTGNDMRIGDRSGVIARVFDGDIDEVRIYNRALDAAEVAYNYNAGVGTYTPFSTTGLVGWWHMELGEGASVTDYSGNGNHGTITGATWVNGHVPLPPTEIGTNPATPTFRTVSSDPDISANMTAFLPISEAKAPDYTLAPASPFISSTPNITGNFTIVPPIGGFPLAGVFVAIAGALTPPQMPLMIISIFFILVVSLSTSYTMRRYGSGSLIIKSVAIIVVMGILVAIGNMGFDFWMIFVFAVIATAFCMASRQLGWQ